MRRLLTFRKLLYRPPVGLDYPSRFQCKAIRRGSPSLTRFGTAQAKLILGMAAFGENYVVRIGIDPQRSGSIV